MYAVLDSVIDKAAQKITPLKQNKELPEREVALSILKAIDSSLWEMDFIVCIKTHFLHQSLRKTQLPLNKSKLHFWSGQDTVSESGSNFYGASLNASAYPQVTLMSGPKKDEFLSEPQSSYHLIDCDLAAYIYLGVAEALDLPIYMVEVPGHFFVRYT